MDAMVMGDNVPPFELGNTTMTLTGLPMRLLSSNLMTLVPESKSSFMAGSQGTSMQRALEQSGLTLSFPLTQSNPRAITIAGSHAQVHLRVHLSRP